MTQEEDFSRRIRNALEKSKNTKNDPDLKEDSNLQKLNREAEKTLKKDGLDFEKKRLKNSHIRERIKNIKKERNMRTEYANKVYRYLVCYSRFCAIILLLQGFSLCNFRLSNTSIGLLIGSTAVSAISLVAIVLRGLFKAPLLPGDKPAREEKRPQNK